MSINKKVFCFLFALILIFSPFGVNHIFRVSFSKIEAAVTINYTDANILDTSASAIVAGLGANTTYPFYVYASSNTTKPFITTTITSTASGNAPVTVTGLVSNTSYYFSVPTTVGGTTLVNSTSFTTKAAINNGNQTVGITATNMTATSALVTITANAVNAPYQISLLSQAGTVISQKDVYTIDLGTGTFTYTFSNLTSDTPYLLKLTQTGTGTMLGATNFVTSSSVTGGGVIPPSTQSPAVSSTVAFSGLVPLCNVGKVIKIAETKSADGKTVLTPAKYQFAQPCDFEYFMMLINKIIDFLLFVMATPIFVLIFIYAAFLYLSDGGSSENIKRAKGILKKAVIGYVIALAAWLVIKTILLTLNYNGPMYLSSVMAILNYF